ncbi:MAG: EF-hand domain-containing protein [Alphaproteobacteria bacterium]|nr:EF-hand domain-containing protein [Alphaproteobacteria bacterium]
MTRNLALFPVLAALLWPGAAAAQRDWTAQELETLRTQFDSLDRDRSGDVTALEWTEPTRKLFKRLDKNKNGFVEEGEFMAWRAPSADVYMTAPAFGARRQVFYQTDFDLDRRLHLEEFLFQAMLAFRNRDTDRDGRVTFEEFSRLPLGRQKARPRGDQGTAAQ